MPTATCRDIGLRRSFLTLTGSSQSVAHTHHVDIARGNRADISGYWWKYQTRVKPRVTYITRDEHRYEYTYVGGAFHTKLCRTA